MMTVHSLQNLACMTGYSALSCCCRNDPCVEGGETIILDGFAVVEELRRSFPNQFNTLTRTPVTFDKIQAGK